YRCGDHRTAICVGKGLTKEIARAITRLNPDGVYIVSDAKTRPAALALAEALPKKVSAQQLSVPRGEAAKTLDHAERLFETMLAKGVSRDTILIAIGGGALGDLVGFVASVVMRGIRWLHCPTTLLAMVDASVGGKTAINSPRGKNLIGAFHQPEAVFADFAHLASLPNAEKRAALAEVIKIASTSSAALFKKLEDAEDLLAEPLLQAAVLGSLRLKAKVVEEDEREAGKRRMLNFGHTVGHALEEWSGHKLRHGEAVAIGIAVESRMGVALKAVPESTASRIQRLIAKAGLARTIPQEIRLKEMLSFIGTDKKRQGDTIVLPLPFRIGAWKETRISPQEAAELAMRC
ncbi:MAG: 3-dehydroquinate synthase, partial [Planctomycetes bacterium]|nr:3-dehydroquinate synthase [Planctomycetota bacterium]